MLRDERTKERDVTRVSGVVCTDRQVYNALHTTTGPLIRLSRRTQLQQDKSSSKHSTTTHRHVLASVYPIPTTIDLHSPVVSGVVSGITSSKPHNLVRGGDSFDWLI